MQIRPPCQTKRTIDSDGGRRTRHRVRVIANRPAALRNEDHRHCPAPASGQAHTAASNQPSFSLPAKKQDREPDFPATLILACQHHALNSTAVKPAPRRYASPFRTHTPVACLSKPRSQRPSADSAGRADPNASPVAQSCKTWGPILSIRGFHRRSRDRATTTHLEMSGFCCLR